jgi:formylglycine-generating enzyme
MLEHEMKKRALLIGINKYHLLGELKYARQDAESVAEALCGYCGFTEQDITIMSCSAEGGTLGLSRYIELALLNLSAAKDLDLMVLGFWGHGFSPKPGVRYLCGIDTVKEDLERTAVSFDVVKAKLTQVQAENTLILLDCCQDNPLGRSVHCEPMTMGEEAVLDSLARDIQAAHRKHQKRVIPTVAILNSCSEGQKAYEWASRGHGVFTAHLLDSFKEGFGGVASMSSWIAERVRKTADEIHHQEQIPYVLIEGKGDIPLVIPGVKAAAHVVKPPEKKTEPYWWLVVEGKETGPFEEREILEKIKSKELNRGCDCWREGMESWQPIGQTKEWGKLFPPERKEAKVITPPRRRIEPPSEITGKDGAAMVLVPSGEFMMGSPKGEGNGDEHPQHKVYLKAYYIDKCPVTVKQYKRYCKETGKDMPKAPSRGWKDEHPTVRVTWEEAVEYAEYYGKRLPTEAEWEKACRAGSKTAFYFGDKSGLGKHAWFYGNSGQRIHSVGRKKANALGIYDMHGNISEWCSDWYDEEYYEKSPGENPQGPDSGEKKVLRGGSCFVPPDFCRTARRDRFNPVLGYFNVGFRCVVSASR